jgi:dipeptidyl aminopeptidase/acylaminoacyl peptidase
MVALAMRILLNRALLTVLVLSAGVSAQSSDRIDQLLSQLERIRHFGGVSISPDGAWVTWTEDPTAGKSRIYLKSRAGSGEALRVTAGGANESFAENGVTWRKDSKAFAFISNASGSPEIYVASIDDPGKPGQVTHVKGDITDLRWSPDGKQVAFLHTPGGNTGGPLAAVPAQTGVIGSGFENQRLAVVNAGTREMRAVTPKDLNIYEYSWSPDGAAFAAIAAPGPADNNWWIAKLYRVNSTTGRMTETYNPPVGQQIAVPRWSPDGSRIGFIGGLMSDEGFLGGDIYAVDAKGGPAKNLTPDIRISPNGLRWQSNSEILFTASVDGEGAIAKLNVPSGTSEMMWKGESVLHEDGNYPNFAMADDGKTSAAVIADWEHAPEVWAGRTGEWKRATHANADARPQWGKAESLVWNDDGFRVQGWLLYPQNFDATKRYPMVVSIHGGPASERSPAWPSVHFDMSAMAGLGYFVFFPNPRGSYGEGEAFTQANVKNFGYGDLRDVLSGVDAVLKKAPVDANRIGVTGWSYGGYMTMWTVTQTTRFRAAVAGAGIANWLSYYGENSIDKWMIPYFGASVYDDPKVYEKSSPITFIKQVKTPTLVVVGERDGECPAPQSFEFWHALKNEGVPTELVVYPGEGHSFKDARNRVDVMRRTLAWFDRYLGG